MLPSIIRSPVFLSMVPKLSAYLVGERSNTLTEQEVAMLTWIFLARL
jgi:hypothetical protein